jgi:hypothetical protein
MGQQYRIDFADRGAYLFARLDAESDSLEAALDSWHRIASRCRALGLRRVLVEEHIKDRLSSLDLFHLTSQIPRIASGVRVAFVDVIPDHFEHNLFGETVARNRGLTVRVFHTTSEAEAWLLS